jgi:hypothetical protein
MPLEDKAARRRVEHEISRHSLDFSMGNVQVLNNICYISGRVKHMHSAGGRTMDLEKEMLMIAEAIRSIAGIHDVVLDCDCDG